jgi:Helicase associated domain
MVFTWVWKSSPGGERMEGEGVEGSNDSSNEAPARSKQEENETTAAPAVKSAMGESSIQETSQGSNDAVHSSSGRKNKTIASTPSQSQKKSRLSEEKSTEQNDGPDGDISHVAPSSVSAIRMSYPFDVMYERLVAFHREKGHCRVPQNYKGDPQLASWVKNLRRNRRPGKILCDENVRKLDAIGFCWESRAGRPIGATIEAGAKSPARKFRKPFQLDDAE